MKLLEDKLINGDEIYTHNSYNSFEFPKILTERNTHCTGTLRKYLISNPKEVNQKIAYIFPCIAKEFT